MNELALFAGAGGGILGGRLLGWRTICAVELDPYCRRILMQRQSDRILEPFPIWDDVRTFDGRPWRGRVDVVSGGFPCQDISVAGKGAGLSGERSGLWGEMRRIIGEVGPRFVLVENSPALTRRGLGTVLGDLAALGYHARWGVLGAVHAGAPHKRERIWIIGSADTDRERCEEHSEPNCESERSARPFGHHINGLDHSLPDARAPLPANGARERPLADAESLSERESSDEAHPFAVGRDARPEPLHRSQCSTLAHSEGEATRRLSSGAAAEDSRSLVSDPPLPDTDRAGCEEQRSPLAFGAQHQAAQCRDWWAAEPDVGRMAHGVASRVDQLKSLGNGQVPAVAALAWRILTA